MGDRLYLVIWGPHVEAVPEALTGTDHFALHPGVHAVATSATRSRLYHGVKRTLPAGSALMVCALHEIPKFKGMAPGALAWFRARMAAH